MKKSDLERFHKIRNHSRNIQKTLQNIVFEEFKDPNDADARDVCAFRLFQIGEHSNKLSADIKKQYSDFNWGATYRFRNVLGHDYESVSANAIWKTCREDIPKLLAYVDKIISELESECNLASNEIATNKPPE